MKLLQQFPEEREARLAGDILEAAGIAVSVEAEAGTSSLWILDEDRIPEAFQLLDRWRANPAAPEFVDATTRATRQRTEREKSRKASMDVVDVRTRVWGSGAPLRPGFLTTGLIVFSIAATVFRIHGDQFGLEPLLLMSTKYSGLQEIRAGQLWRLLSPIILHFGFLHLFFNMSWLIALGSQIESYEGSLKFTGIVVSAALVGNIAQYLIAGPFFGGMSGVVSAVIPYVFLMSRDRVSSRYRLSTGEFVFSVVWLLLCLTGWVGPIANAAHLGGFAVGTFWAVVTMRRIPLTNIRF